MLLGLSVGAVAVAALASSSSPGAESTVSPTGLALEGGRIVICDWGAWMRFAPDAVAATLRETNDVDEIVANLFRRAFPAQAWPPEDPDLREQWGRIVAAVGRTMDRPFRPHLEIVS